MIINYDYTTNCHVEIMTLFYKLLFMYKHILGFATYFYHNVSIKNDSCN